LNRRGNKSLLVLFFRKEQESSFSEEKEAKRLLFLALRRDACLIGCTPPIR
jgi:hypothetical protein